MRTRTNYRDRNRKYAAQPFWDFILNNRSAVILGGLFLVGVAFGTSAVRTLEESTVQGLLSVLGVFLEARQTQNFAETLMSSLTQNLILLLVLFFCGFCAISGPIIYLIPIFKGLGYGLTAGALLTFYGARALPFVSFLMLPTILLATMILVAACDEALKMSRKFLSVIKPIELQRGEQLPTTGAYCVKFSVFFFAMIGCGFIESYLFLFGSGLFGI